MSMIEELTKYTITKIEGNEDKRNIEKFFVQSSPQISSSEIGTIEIKAYSGYREKKKLGQKLRRTVREFYSKQGFNLTYGSKKSTDMFFERKINFLERYLVSVERQGVFFYIHVMKR